MKYPSRGGHYVLDFNQAQKSPPHPIRTTRWTLCLRLLHSIQNTLHEAYHLSDIIRTNGCITKNSYFFTRVCVCVCVRERCLFALDHVCI